MGRFILPSEIEYNKIFINGVEINIYPTKEQRDDVDILIKNAIATNIQLKNEDIKNIIGDDVGSGDIMWRTIIKVLDDASWSQNFWQFFGSSNANATK